MLDLVDIPDFHGGLKLLQPALFFPIGGCIIIELAGLSVSFYTYKLDNIIRITSINLGSQYRALDYMHLQRLEMGSEMLVY